MSCFSSNAKQLSVIFHLIEPDLRELSEIEQLPDEKAEQAIELIFWLQIFNQPHQSPSENFFQDFIHDNQSYFSKKPILLSWFKACQEAIPKFYFVGQYLGTNAFVAVDIESEKTIEVILPNPKIKSPKEGTIVANLLLPYPDHLYFPVTDFYTFNPQATHEIATHIQQYLDELSENPDQYENFLLMFLELLDVEKYTLDGSK
ncbi:hypothetical protein [Tenuibacillus multivorans]|uniref:Uncharacterized protein n=1 Tax=Tenuibacillus multivorans TaxID=237069 RepID=A0A1H0DZT6_9BACI|nr:hypothetical protein [Tenuibacillus multivorans]GEL76714.1 hypothetical protein TMU01_09490 [Tenuibacillus multivorans]SDN75598.1 hypothetical protein SAMN05216498_3006 [Tenuibacillus multivorans]